MTTAIAKQNLKPELKIFAYLYATGNQHTARELATILGLGVGTVRRRITDLGRHLVVVNKIREGVRHVNVYAAR